MSTGRIVVAGSINLDILVRVDRLPVAGETVAASELSRQLGGKGANQAVAAARAGATVELVGATGSDAASGDLLDGLRAEGVGVHRVRTVDAPTGTALVVTSAADNQIVVAAGANALVDPRWLEEPPITNADICLAQLEIPSDAVRALFRRARAEGALTVLNPSPFSCAAFDLVPLTDLLIVNETELGGLVGCDAAWRDPARLAGELSALGLSPDATVVVTLGSNGVLVLYRQAADRVAAHEVRVVDTTGAGDCFCGYLVSALVFGAAMSDAVREANAAAAMSTRSWGAASSIPSRMSVLRFLDTEQ